MSINLKQNPDGSAGFEGGSTGGVGEFIPVNIPYVATSAATSPVFVASRNFIVQDIRGRVNVAGTGGACTISLYSVPSGTAVASGTLLHTGSFNVVGTALANQSLTLSTTAANLVIPAGNSIGYVITGTPTSAIGVITVTLTPSN